MPLKQGTSEETFSSNVKELMDSGKYDQKQALAIAYSVKRKGKSISSTDWRAADALSKQIEDEMKPVLDCDYVDFDFGNGTLTVNKDVSGYKSWLSINDEIVHESIGEKASDIVTALFMDGMIQPKSSSCNDEHVEYMNSQMEKMEMSKKDYDNDGDIDEDHHLEPEDKEEVDTGKSPLDRDDKNSDNDSDDEEMLDKESNKDFGNMSSESQDIVRQLLEKHNSQQMPQISEYPDGGNEVRIFSEDGLYYYYIITPDNEVVHLAIMGKSMQKKIAPTMEDLMRKSNPVFENDFNFFKKCDQDTSLKKTFLMGDTELLYPSVPDWETGVGNALTTQLKHAILKKQHELGAGLHAIVNNNDGTYKVIFELWGIDLNQTEPKQVGYNVDRDGNFTETINEVLIMKSAFNDNYKFTSTIDELSKSSEKVLKVKEVDLVKKSRAVNNEFFKEVKMGDLIEDYKKEVLNAQYGRITNHGDRKVVL